MTRPTCPDCGSSMCSGEEPRELFVWHLWGWELRLWKWHTTYTCTACLEDPAEDYSRECEEGAYRKGREDGYRDAMEEIHR